MTTPKKRPTPPQPPPALPPEMNAMQRHQLGSALDCLTDAESYLAALLSSEPPHTIPLMRVLRTVHRLSVTLMVCYADPVPPPPPAALSNRRKGAA